MVSRQCLVLLAICVVVMLLSVAATTQEIHNPMMDFPQGKHLFEKHYGLAVMYAEDSAISAGMSPLLLLSQSK